VADPATRVAGHRASQSNGIEQIHYLKGLKIKSNIKKSNKIILTYLF
jgi:hypothetical protein